jgi:hypothetical protein
MLSALQNDVDAHDKISVVFQIVANAEIINVMDYWNLTNAPTI